MYGCESWTTKKAECRRINTFELWCCRRLLKVPWAARRSNQSILMEISPGCSLEVLMLKLKLQCFGHLMRRTDSLENTLMLGKIEGRRRRGWQRTRWLDGITVNGHEFEQALGDGEGQGSLACCSPWGWKESDTTEQLNNNNSLVRTLSFSLNNVPWKLSYSSTHKDLPLFFQLYIIELWDNTAVYLTDFLMKDSWRPFFIFCYYRQCYK